MGTVDPTPEQIQALMTLPADRPVVMVNLLEFRADGGVESYQRYGREVAPHLERVGARLIYSGSAEAQVIGDGTRPWWHAIVVVEYPSPAAFVEMVTDEGYREVHEHRAAALDSAELIATSSWAVAD
jgi:uncharacterized protein (DUF1330 family)